MSTASAQALCMCEKRPKIKNYICEKRPIKIICLLFYTTHVYCIHTIPIHARKETYNCQLFREKRSVKVTCLLFYTTHVYCIRTSPLHVRKETYNKELHPQKETYKKNMPALLHYTCLLHPHQPYTCAKRDL